MPKKPKTYSVHGNPMGRKPKPPGSPKGRPPARPFPKGVAQNPNGRASTYTEELGERIVELLWTGECRSIRQVAEQDGMPTRRTIFNWKNKYPDFDVKLTEAQASLGELYADDIDDITDGVLAGTIDPTAGNVAIKSKQWKAMVTNPRNYSTKSYVEKTENKTINHTYTNRIPIEGYSDEEKDAIEGALRQAVLLLEGPNGRDSTAGED